MTRNTIYKKTHSIVMNNLFEIDNSDVFIKSARFID